MDINNIKLLEVTKYSSQEVLDAFAKSADIKDILREPITLQDICLYMADNETDVDRLYEYISKEEVYFGIFFNFEEKKIFVVPEDNEPHLNSKDKDIIRSFMLFDMDDNQENQKYKFIENYEDIIMRDYGKKYLPLIWNLNNCLEYKIEELS